MENKTAAELIEEAGKLNNHPKLVVADHVSIMGMMTHAEMVKHVKRLKDMVGA